MDKPSDGILACRIEESECPFDVRIDRRSRRENTAVYVRLRGEVYDGIGAMLLDKRTNQSTVANVAPYELMPRVSGNRFEILEVTRVSQLV